MNYRDLESVHIISDDPEAVKALVAAAKTGQFEHVAQRQRDARDLAEATAGLRAEPLTADGVPVIDAPRYDEKKITRLWDLGTAESRSPTTRTPRAPAGSPGSSGRGLARISAQGVGGNPVGDRHADELGRCCFVGSGAREPYCCELVGESCL